MTSKSLRKREPVGWGLFNGRRSATLITLLTLLVLVSLINCQDKKKDIIIEKPPGIIYGFVSDSITSAPIESAAISPFDTNHSDVIPEYTDSLGHYRLPLMPDPNVPVYCLKTGYKTQARNFVIVSDESTHSDFLMVPGDTSAPR